MHTNRPVLIAYDGSKDARAAISVPGRLFPGSQAVVLYAREPLEAVAAHLEGASGARRPPPLRHRGPRRVGEGRRRGRRAGERRRTERLSSRRIDRTDGRAGDHDAAEAIDAELILVGSRGRRGLRAALLGSTSTTVLHRTGRPTLVVPPRTSAARPPR